jgi:hypothetical protein
MMSDSHWSFIVAAYVIAVLVIGGMTVKILIDYRGLKRALGRLAGTSPARDDLP